MLKKLMTIGLLSSATVSCADAQTSADDQDVLVVGAQISADAQASEGATRISIASYSVRFSDIPAFSALYRGAAVPIMETLVEDGMIGGYGVRMHNVGGKYNIRWHLAGMEGSNFEQAWTAITTGLDAADSEALEAFNRSILAHKDEIWTLGARNVESPDEAAYLYENLFKVNRADLAKWNELWGEVLPALDVAISDGLMRGYVVEDHNMGGEFNWNLVVFFDDWDTIDDATAIMFENIPLDHEIWTMAIAHKDELWAQMPDMN